MDQMQVNYYRERVRILENAITIVVTTKFDDLCWRDVYVDLAALVDIDFHLEQLPREQFLRNCAHFHDCLASGKTYTPPDNS